MHYFLQLQFPFCKKHSSVHKRNGQNDRAVSDCQRTCFPERIVGASLARPPKNVVFRISRRKITVFSPCGDGFCFGKIHGRPRVAPTGTFLTNSNGTVRMTVPFSCRIGVCMDLQYVCPTDIILRAGFSERDPEWGRSG